MNPPLSLDSSFTESDVFYGERSSEENSPTRINTPAVLNSTQLTRAMERKTVTISSVASPELNCHDRIQFSWTHNSIQVWQPTSNCATQPQWPQLATQTSNVLATMTVIQPDEQYSTQSPEPSNPSPISKTPLNLSTIECWETPYTTRDDATF